jgi:NitT/TauT family transport system substrate-binding protein
MRISAFRPMVPVAVAAAVLLASAAAVAETRRIRIGHFPNVTHVQGVVAHHLSRQGKGWFEQRLGGDFAIDWYVYNAGPSAMEAFFADSIDLTYVGPSPALNAYAKSNAAEVRIIAGAANAGEGLVVHADSPLKNPADFRGKIIATPQLGNTQDVAARAWLVDGGLRITQTGGDAHVLPTANPDQLGLFQNRKVDAVWTVEPWVSRLEIEAKGKVIVEDRDAVTTVLASSAKFLGKDRELARKIVEAHRALTQWIKEHPDEAQRIVREELGAEMRGTIPEALVASAWKRIVLTDEVSRASLEKYVGNAQKAGFLRSIPDLGRLFERP